MGRADGAAVVWGALSCLWPDLTQHSRDLAQAMAWQQSGVQMWVLVCREAVTCLPGVTRQLPDCDCSCAHRRAMLGRRCAWPTTMQPCCAAQEGRLSTTFSASLSPIHCCAVVPCTAAPCTSACSCSASLVVPPVPCRLQPLLRHLQAAACLPLWLCQSCRRLRPCPSPLCRRSRTS